MPGRRVYRSRRRPGPIRRRKMRVRRMLRRAMPRVHHFKRTVYLEQAIQATSTVATSTNYSFALNNLPDVTDFTNLFDQYCIKKVVFKMIPRFSQFNAVYSNPNNLFTQVHTAIDYDDASALPTTTGLNEIVQYESHRVTRANQTHTRVLVPRVELSGASAAFPKAYQWIDCDNINALHNGVKVFIPKMDGTGNALTYDVQMTFYIKCKNVL